MNLTTITMLYQRETKVTISGNNIIMKVACLMFYLVRKSIIVNGEKSKVNKSIVKLTKKRCKAIKSFFNNPTFFQQMQISQTHSLPIMILGLVSKL